MKLTSTFLVLAAAVAFKGMAVFAAPTIAQGSSDVSLATRSLESVEPALEARELDDWSDLNARSEFGDDMSDIDARELEELDIRAFDDEMANLEARSPKVFVPERQRISPSQFKKGGFEAARRQLRVAGAYNWNTNPARRRTSPALASYLAATSRQTAQQRRRMNNYIGQITRNRNRGNYGNRLVKSAPRSRLRGSPPRNW